MRVVEIVFSPSGGTARAARMVSCRWSDAPLCIDLSDAGTDFSECRIEADDFVLVAMPSFSGRAPAVAMERFCRIAGNGARCVLLCVYGNRAYEDNTRIPEQVYIIVQKVKALFLTFHQICGIL